MSAATSPPAVEAPAAELIETAERAGLVYSSDRRPGYTRRREGEQFVFYNTRGERITDEAETQRIRSLAIPPAYENVWICPNSRGHLQATGRDARGRKQYRYHPRWRQVADETKYSRLLTFARTLPKIRERVGADLALPGLCREKVLAVVVKLLETTLIRVGNEEYARENRSYGLTTLRNRHVQIKGSKLIFSFRGKSGVDHTIALQDQRLARTVQRIRDLPGQELFQYLDDDGKPVDVDSADVNAYLQSISGHPFTAKDFRTWAGTVLAALALKECEACDSQAAAKKNIVQAIEQVAKRLGNTPSICRKCYVHPAVFEAYLDDKAVVAVARQAAEAELHGENLARLKPEEAAVVALLRQRLREAADEVEGK